MTASCEYRGQLTQLQKRANDQRITDVGGPKCFIDSLNRCANRGLMVLAHIAGRHEFIDQPVSMWREDDSMLNQTVSLEN